MPTISISPTFSTMFNRRILANNFGNAMYPAVATELSGASTQGLLVSNYGGAGSGAVHWHIMKGTIPADFSTLTSYSARAADVLVNFHTGPATGTVTNPGVLAMFATSTIDTTNPVTITSQFVNAVASGTATWFWWTVRGITNSPTDALFHQIIGTVGVFGSGADLEIQDTAIVTGQPYRIANFKLALPTTWTY